MGRVRAGWRLLAGALATAVPVAASGQEPGDVYVANLSGGNVVVYDGTTGSLVRELVPAGAGSLAAATGLAFGPDGDLLVASSGTHQILRFDPDSGEFLGVFAEHEELSSPYSMAFGPTGDLFVSSGSCVLRFDAAGAFAGVVVGGLETPIGLRFAADGSLWIAHAGAHEVVRVDPETGARLGSPLRAEELRFPSDLLFTPDDRLLVSSAFTGSVLAFDPRDGALLGVAATLPDGGVPMGLALATDETVLIGDFRGGRLFGLDAASGELSLRSAELFAGPENLAVRPQRGPAGSDGRDSGEHAAPSPS